jgi:hemolysin activation/secretion protein
LALVTASAAGLGQGAGIVLPGQIERQLRSLPQPRGIGAVPGATDELPQQVIPSGADAIRFTLNAIDVADALALSSSDIARRTAPYLNREISLADLYRLADELSAVYRENDYLLAQVIVPAQEIIDGRVRLQAVEGYIDAVRVTGESVGDDDLVIRYADRIRRQRPLTNATLEHYMLLINDLPGVFATATLSPSPDRFGAADLTIDLARRQFDAGIDFDNRGGKVLGNARVLADAGIANLFGRHDNSSVRTVLSPGGELRYIALRHDQPVGAEGGRIGIGYSDTRARPEEQSFIPLKLETRSQQVELGYSYPLKRSRAENRYLRATLTAFDGREYVFGVKDREDRLRSLRLGLTWDLVGNHNETWIVDAEASFGLDILGASDNGDPLLTRPAGQVDYRKVELFTARLQDLSRHWSVLAALNGQYAFDPLLSSELFAFGGESFGRGYDPSELVGDHGLAGKLELRYAALWELPRTIPLQAYGFYDIGRVWAHREAPLQFDASAASAGLGTRLVFGGQVNGFIELSKPLTRDLAAEGNRDLRLYAGISIRL